MITIEEIQRIKKDAENKRRIVERTKGNLDQLLKALKKEFDCKNIEQAKEKLEQIRQQGETLSSNIEKLQSKVVALWNKIEDEEEEE